MLTVIRLTVFKKRPLILDFVSKLTRVENIAVGISKKGKKLTIVEDFIDIALSE